MLAAAFDVVRYERGVYSPGARLSKIPNSCGH